MTADPDMTALCPTIIAGTRYDDDFAVIWRELPIGRIMRASGLPLHVPQWRWNVNVPGKPSGASGSGDDLNQCKAAFKVAWVKVRAGLTEDDISRTIETTAASREAIALISDAGRFDRRALKLRYRVDALRQKSFFYFSRHDAKACKPQGHARGRLVACHHFLKTNL